MGKFELGADRSPLALKGLTVNLYWHVLRVAVFVCVFGDETVWASLNRERTGPPSWFGHFHERSWW